MKLSGEEQFAFDEFLFGLSYEDLLALREKMDGLGKTSVSEQEIKDLLQKDRIYSGHPGSSPREFYSFFVQRKNNAAYRKRLDLRGPKKTLEEHVMFYLLKQSGSRTGQKRERPP